MVLTGGDGGGVVRLGDTVRRKTGPWTPAVHALLAHVAPWSGSEPLPTPADVADRIPVRMGAACDPIAAGQRAGDAGLLSPARIGEPAATVAAVAAYAKRLPLLRVEVDPRLG